MSPRKTTITTKQEIDGEEAVQSPGEPEPDINEADIELAEFFENLAGSANKIKIYKIVNGERNYCGSAEPAIVTEDYILRTYKAGKYFLQATSNGKYVTGGNRTISIYEPPMDPYEARQNPVENSGGEIAILREQINRQHEMLLQLLQRKDSENKVPSITELLALVMQLQQANKPPDMSAVLPSVMTLFKDTVEMAREAASGSDGKTDWAGLALKAVDKLPAIVGQIAAMRTAEKAPDNPPVAAGEGDEKMQIENAVKTGIAWLKQKALAGKDPVLQADFILDNFDNPVYRAIGVRLMNMQFEDFAKFDPEIVQEPLRKWFQEVYNALREGLSDDSSVTAGADGGGADTKGNASVDD